MSLLKIHDKKCRKAGKKEQEGGKSANILAQPIHHFSYMSQNHPIYNSSWTQTIVTFSFQLFWPNQLIAAHPL